MTSQKKKATTFFFATELNVPFEKLVKFIRKNKI